MLGTLQVVENFQEKLSRSSELDIPISDSELFHHFCGALADLRRESSASDWMHFCKIHAANHPSFDYFRQEPITKRAWLKPRGYAGDAELFDWIYYPDQYLQTFTGTSRELFSLMVESDVCKSVRNRRTVLAKYIDCALRMRKQPRILALGSGYLREWDLVKPSDKENIPESYLAIDHDPVSLEKIKSNPSPVPNLHTICGSVLGEEALTTAAHKGPFDLIYAAGLFDYLNQAQARSLVRRVLPLLSSGGTLLVANLCEGHDFTAYLEAAADWWLVYRRPEDLLGLVEPGQAQMIAWQQVFYDETGSTAFVEFIKR